MTRAKDLIDAIEGRFTEDQQVEMMGEIMLIALPMPLVKVLSDEASKRNLTLIQFLGEAINSYVRVEESSEPPKGPQLLVEG